MAGVAVLMQQGNLVEAEQRLHRYLLKVPHSARANNLLGEIFFRQGRYDQAEDALQKAVAGAPALVEPRLNLGDAFLAEGKLESALTAYQGACKIAPHDVRANLALAVEYRAADQVAQIRPAWFQLSPFAARKLEFGADQRFRIVNCLDAMKLQHQEALVRPEVFDLYHATLAIFPERP